MSLQDTAIKVDVQSTNDQIVLESLSTSSFGPPTAEPNHSIVTSEIQSSNLQNSSDEPRTCTDGLRKESFSSSNDKSPTDQSQENTESSTKKRGPLEGKMTPEELKRERNRRLAREFRARKKEEIRLYRSTIVNLTQKVRTLTAENQKLQSMIKEIGDRTICNDERKAEKHKDEQIHKLQKQVLLHQILLQRLKEHTRQELCRQKEKQYCSSQQGNQYSSPENWSSPLPSIKTFTQLECTTTDSICSPAHELQQHKTCKNISIPSMSDIPLSTLVFHEAVNPESMSQQHLDNRFVSGNTECTSSRGPNNVNRCNYSSFTPHLESPLIYKSNIWDSPPS